ncbi:MAG: EVE domain-containing protein [Opitutales bacterium]
MAKNYWLMKSEPDVFSLEDLRQRPNQTEPWDGVRNYQARNFMRDDMKPGDCVLFYHSNAKPPGVAGLAEIASEAFPDETAFDPDSDYYDPKSTREEPRWVAVKVRFVEAFGRIVPLAELKAEPALADLPIVRKGNRLSICSVTKAHYEKIRKMAKHSEG